MNMVKMALFTGLTALMLSLAPSPARAQLRWVVVNGALQNPMQLAMLDRYACLVVPNGSYWLDYNTGIWGYAGSPRPMGRIGDACNQGYSRSGRPSLSERGLLYSSEPWGRGR